MIKRRASIREILFCALMAAPIGAITGVICAIFGRVLLWITAFRGEHIIQLIPFLAVAGVLIIYMYQVVSPKSLGGMGLVFETGFGENERIPKALIPLIIAATWTTHLFGGSAGREGVAVQIGATLANACSDFLKKFGFANDFDGYEKIFLIMGMAAGFGGLFQTPLAATFFAVEVLVVGSIFYKAIIPSAIAAFIASYTSHFLGLEKFTVCITERITCDVANLCKLAVIAAAFGLVGGLFAFALKKVKGGFAKILPNAYKRILILGVLLSIALFLLHDGRYCGLGTNLIDASFNSGTIYSYDFLLKFAFTVLTLSAGFQGGEVTPLFSIGATLGTILGQLLGLPMTLMAALGYAAVFGGATNTLIAPIFIGIEVFGVEHFGFFVVACIIAYVCSGNSTIYGKQKGKKRFLFKLED